MSSTPRSKDYKVDDRELLLPLFQRFFWKPIVPLIPSWIAPNAITIFGALCSIAAVPCAVAGGAGHLGFWGLSALLLFIYTTADNLDGAHARRTGQASKVGEFLDHGLDGLSTGVLFIIPALIITDNPVLITAIVIIGILGYSITFWEQYHCGKLVIPMLGQIEGMVTIAGAEIVMGLLGNPSWSRYNGSFNVGAVYLLVIAIGFVVDFGAPFVRSLRAGAPLMQYVPLAAVTLLLGVPSLQNANPFIIATSLSLSGATSTLRLILMRLSGVEVPLVGVFQVLGLVPVALSLIFPSIVWPNLGAAISMGLVAIAFSVDLAKGIVFARRVEPPAPTPA
ncbi:MAG: CDP-alcohol phosphatidyltransferase family protein [Polyangiaceae bacterium]